MKVMPLVSIIVPVYNVEKYLDRCVKSLLNQTYENIEIILVNDGSNDKSGGICDSFQKSCSRINVIHQFNKGNSAARNRGYKESNGDYFMFVDSDDYLSVETVSEMVQTAEKANADVVLGTMNREGKSTGGEISVSNEEMVKLCINQRKYQKELRLPDFVRYINPGSPCVKLIKRNACNNIGNLFEEDIRTHHEDTLFSIKLYVNVQKIVLLDSQPYLYDREVSGSLTKSFYHNKIDEIIRLLGYMDILLEETAWSEELVSNLKMMFTVEMVYECWSDYFTNRSNKSSFRDRINDLRRLVDNKNIQQRLECYGSLEEYRKYQRLVLYSMCRRNYAVLSAVSILWTAVKGK